MNPILHREKMARQEEAFGIMLMRIWGWGIFFSGPKTFRLDIKPVFLVTRISS